MRHLKIDELRCFGAAENPIFDIHLVYIKFKKKKTLFFLNTKVILITKGFSVRMARVKRKRPFILLEVLIAIGIASIALSWIITSSSKQMHKQMEAAARIDRQRLFELEFFDCFYELRKQKSFNPRLAKTCQESKIKTMRDGKSWKTLKIVLKDPKLKLKANMKALLCLEKNSSTLHVEGNE